jgi:hypothetical protein
LDDLLANYRGAALHRELDFTLTRDDFVRIVTGDCTYCGAAPVLRQTKRGARYGTRHAVNGVDRVDPTQGYVPGNCVAACSMCNQMKFDYSREEFLAQVRRIAAHSDAQDLMDYARRPFDSEV